MDINFNHDFRNKKFILLLVAAVLLLVLAESTVLRLISSAESEVRAKRTENTAMQTSLSRKSEAMAYYKSNVKLDTNIAIEQMESPTKVYSYLLDLLTSLGIKDARVVKAPDIEGSVCFNISGSNDYFVILNILEALRSDGKMQKVTELNLSAAADGSTSYSLTVAVSLKPENASQTNGEAPKGEGSVSQ